jgi:hypothetical protein
MMSPCAAFVLAVGAFVIVVVLAKILVTADTFLDGYE